MIIDDILKQKNMSRYELWKRSGLSQATIYDLCNERIPLSKCRIATLSKLANALEISVDVLLPSAVIKKETSSVKRRKNSVYKTAYEEGLKDGYKIQIKDSIDKLISNLGISHEEACRLLGVESSE